MSKDEKKVVIAGHICLDITPVFSSDKVIKLEEVLVPGKLVFMKGVDVHTGGAVANTGLGMKILGVDVKLMGKIGKDSFGQLILNILEKYDASEGMIISETSSTSYSIVLAPPGVDRVFLHNPGANDTFTFEDLNLEIIKKACLFHFGYPPLMKKIYDDEGKELVKIFRRVKELGVATSLDMAAVDASSEAGKAPWETILKNVLPFVDFFMPSIEEIGYMIDRPRYEEWIKCAKGQDITSVISIEKDVKPLADKLITLGAKVVIIKCGSAGMYYKVSDEIAMDQIVGNLGLKLKGWAEAEGFEESYEPSKVLSATGAGDTSIAAFLTATLQGYTLEECLQLSTATGASCVTTYDALSGLVPFDKLLEKIHKGWKKQHLGIR